MYIRYYKSKFSLRLMYQLELCAGRLNYSYFDPDRYEKRQFDKSRGPRRPCDYENAARYIRKHYTVVEEGEGYPYAPVNPPPPTPWVSGYRLELIKLKRKIKCHIQTGTQDRTGSLR